MIRILTTALCTCAAASMLAAQTEAQTVTTSTAMAAHAQATPKMKAVAKATTRKDTPASLRREAKISMTTARATALKEVPNGTIRSSELEREKGALIYSFDIKVAGKTGIEEVNVDAMTGAVLAHEHETPRVEAKEARSEKREAKK